MPESQQPSPLGPKAFLVLLILFLLVPMLCCGGCSLLLSLWQQPAPVQAPHEP